MASKQQIEDDATMAWQEWAAVHNFSVQPHALYQAWREVFIAGYLMGRTDG